MIRKIVMTFLLLSGAVFAQSDSEPSLVCAMTTENNILPGVRAAGGEWARERGLGAACALIVKYRDARTDAATALEGALR